MLPGNNEDDHSFSVYGREVDIYIASSDGSPRAGSNKVWPECGLVKAFEGGRGKGENCCGGYFCCPGFHFFLNTNYVGNIVVGDRRPGDRLVGLQGTTLALKKRSFI